MAVVSPVMDAPGTHKHPHPHYLSAVIPVPWVNRRLIGDRPGVGLIISVVTLALCAGNLRYDRTGYKGRKEYV